MFLHILLSIKVECINKSIWVKRKSINFCIERPQSILSFLFSLSFIGQIFNQFSMASFPHNFYPDLPYPNNFSDLQTLLMAAGDTGMCGIRNNHNNDNIDLFVSREETFVSSFDQTVSPDQSSSDTSLSPFLTMQHPDLYGPVSDMTVPSLPEFNMSTYDIHSLINCQPQVPGTCNYGDQLIGFVPELKPLYRDTWVINIYYCLG